MEKKDIPKELKEFAERFQEAEFKVVVEQINQAREIIMQRVIHLNEGFTKTDLPKIRRVFGKLNAENALSGEKIQTDDGTWIKKK